MTPRRSAALLAMAAALAVSCAAPPAPIASAELPLGRPIAGPAASALVLRNPGFEAPFPAGGQCPSGWECSAHAGPRTFRFFYDESHPAAGRASGCIEPVGHEPWAKLVQGHRVDALRGRHVRISALVRLDNVAGHGAGLIAVAQGGSGNIMGNRKELEAGSSGWHPVRLDFDLPQSAFLLELGLVLEGTGRACIDEVRFEVL